MPKSDFIKYVYFLICFIFSSVQLQAQSKITFHTDRDYYFPGDTVWFKSYIHVDGNLDTAIHNLAVAFGKGTGEILQQQLNKASLGISFGQYVLPIDFEDSDLFVNIFSKRNLKDDAVLDPVAFKLAEIQNKAVPSVNEANLYIQVEGNGWIPNAVNKLRFQWNNKNIEQAFLVDEQGKELQTLKIDNKALAMAEIQSPTNKLYVHWKYKDKSYVDTVPSIEPLVRMRVTEENDSTRIWIDNQSELPAISFQYIQGDYTILDTLLNLEKGKALKIPIENWMSGRFNGKFLLKDKEQIYSKIIFKAKLADSIKIEPEYMIYRPYGPQRVQLEIPGEEEWNLSVSVVDGLIPNSELENKSEDYQFEGRKFIFYYASKSNLSVNAVQIDDPIAFLSGKIIMKDEKWQEFMELRNDREKRAKRKQEKFRGSSFGIKKLAHLNYVYREVDFDSLGHIILPNITFEDTAQIRFVQIDKRLKTFDYDLVWKFSPLPSIPNLTIPVFVKNLDYSMQYQGEFDPLTYSDDFGKTFIKPVGIERKRNNPFYRDLNEKNSLDWFLFNDANLNIDLEVEDLPPYVFEFKELMRHLRRKYPELGPDGVSNLQPMMLFNNATMAGGNVQIPADITEVSYIRYYKNYPFDNKGLGLIMVYTTGINYRNKDIGISKIKKLLVPGYHVLEEFHQAKYEGEVLVDYDDRQTLYWNPDLAMKGGEPMTISFYNSGRNSSFNIRVQGVSKSGKIIDMVKHIQEFEED